MLNVTESCLETTPSFLISGLLADSSANAFVEKSSWKFYAIFFLTKPAALFQLCRGFGVCVVRRDEIQGYREEYVCHPFESEGDWKHALHNGPWQFDFSVLVMKKYEGNIRPSEMIFDSIEA